MKTFFIIVQLMTTPQVIETSSMEECKALMNQTTIEAYENEAQSVTSSFGTLMVITKNYTMTQYYCGQESK